MDTIAAKLAMCEKSEADVLVSRLRDKAGENGIGSKSQAFMQTARTRKPLFLTEEDLALLFF